MKKDFNFNVDEVAAEQSEMTLRLFARAFIDIGIELGTIPNPRRHEDKKEPAPEALAV